MGRVRVGALAASALCPFAIASQALAQAAPPATVGEIVVTANKRSESILKVAGAITAFRGADLLRSGSTSIADLVGVTPGLQFNAGFGTGAPVIRGVNTGADYGQAVGITVDGAPVGPSSSFQAGGANSLDLDPIDLERVEVLKGPQGTVYGANTLSGLVAYTLKEPDLQKPAAIMRAGVSSTEDGGISYSGRAAISAPLVQDQLAVRLSGFYDDRAGFIDNSLTGASDQNRWQSYGVQGSVLYKPTDRLRVFVAGFYQRQRQDAQDEIVYGADRRPAYGDLTYRDYLVPSTSRTTDVLVAKIDYDLGFADFTSVTSYQRLETVASVPEDTGSLHAIVDGVLPLFGGVSVPAPGLLSDDTTNRFDKVTEEARLASNGAGPLSWLAGVYYTNEQNRAEQDVDARTESGALAATPHPLIDAIIPSTLTEYSAFGNMTYALSPAFDLTGGLRVGWIDQMNRSLFGGADAAAYDALFVYSGLGAGPPADTGAHSQAAVVENYLATARYHFSQDGMVFARFATGFRPGGPNFPVPGLAPTYKPDQTDNYEIGLKSRFWDGRGSIDLTGYDMEWKNFLAFTSAGGLNGFENAGDARILGVEAAASLRPVTGLSLTGTLAYSDSRITSVVAGSTVAKVGDALPYDPRWSGSLSAEYRTPIDPQWDAVAQGSVRYVGSRNSSPQSDVGFPNYRMPAYTLVDLHLGVQSQRIDVDLFVKNLTDVRAQLAAFTELGENLVTVQQPRTVGAAVTFKY